MATKINTTHLAEILAGVKWKPFRGSGVEASFAGCENPLHTMVGESETHVVLLGPGYLGFYDASGGYLEFNLSVACDGDLDAETEGGRNENQS